MNFVINKSTFLIYFFVLFIGQLHAQHSDTIQSKVNSYKISKEDILIPSLLLGASFIFFTDNNILENSEVKKIRNEWSPDFHSPVDNYLQFAPIVLVYTADLFGVKAKNSVLEQSFILLKAEILNQLFVLPIKYLSQVKRPDGSNNHSFPSGHTTEAFMAATFLHKEFGGQSILFSIAGYSIATTVGLLRIANNKHWASDVLAGAAFGILSTNLAYKVCRLKSYHKIAKQLTLEPSYSNSNIKFGIKLAF